MEKVTGSLMEGRGSDHTSRPGAVASKQGLPTLWLGVLPDGSFSHSLEGLGCLVLEIHLCTS